MIFFSKKKIWKKLLILQMSTFTNDSWNFALHYRYKLVPLIVLSIAPHYELILILFYQKILVFRKKNLYWFYFFFFFLWKEWIFLSKNQKKKKSFQIYYGNNLENPKLKIRVFASNNIIEAINQYKMIQDLIQVQCRACG